MAWMEKYQYPGESDLREISVQLGTEWKALATYLGIGQHEVFGIEQDNERRKEQVFQMLIKWRQRQSRKNDIVDILTAALVKCERGDVAQFVRDRSNAATKHAEEAQGLDTFNVDVCRAELKRYYTDAMGSVQLLPWFDEDTTDIDSVFVNPQVNQLINTATGVRETELESYDEIVALNSALGQRVCRILVRGKAGSGKSTLISKLVYDWALKVGKVSNYELVFALNLREIQQHDSLTDMIFDQILSKDTMISKKALELYIRSNADKVLVLLDGYDEYPMARNLNQWSHDQPCDVVDILCAQKLRECCVIVTTRPHKVEDFGQYHRIYSHVSLKGFSSDSINIYIDKFFENSAEKAKALKLKLSQSGPLRDLSVIPIILLMFCLLWNDAQCLPERLTDLFREAFQYFVKTHKNQEGLQIDALEDVIKADVDELVQDVGQTALRGILEPGGKLVFDEHEFADGVVQKACKVGLLSRERTRSKLSIKRSTTFFHKTFQEFCAGCYLASLAEANEVDFLNYLRQIKLERLQDAEYLLRFSCGFNKASAKLVLPYVAHLRGELGEARSSDLDSLEIHIGVSREYGCKQTWMLPVILFQESQEPSLLCSIASVFKSTLPHLMIAQDDPDSAQALDYLLQCNTHSVMNHTVQSIDQLKTMSVFHNVEQVQLHVASCKDIDLTCRLLQSIPHLLSLKLELSLHDYDTQESPDVMDAFSDSIAIMKSLRVFLIYSLIHRIDITPVLDRLRQSETATQDIERLVIYGCTCSTETVVEVLTKQPKLRKLHLAQNCLNPSDLTTIIISVAAHKDLEDIAITQNDVCDSLSDLQPIMSKLKILRLKSTGLSKVHSAARPDLLRCADNLEVFDIANNQIQSETADVFETLPSGSLPSLKDMCLSSKKGMELVGILPFLSRSLSGLLALNLSGFQIGPSQGKLTKLLANKTHLSNLNLSNTSLSYPDIIELADSFPLINALTELTLDENDPGSKGLEALFRGFSNLPNLNEVTISNGSSFNFDVGHASPFLVKCLYCLLRGQAKVCFREDMEQAKASNEQNPCITVMLSKIESTGIDAIKKIVREESDVSGEVFELSA